MNTEYVITTTKVKRVFSAIKTVYRYSLEDLASRKKTMHLAEARQMLIYFLYKECDLTLMDIGRLLNRGHSTILYNAETMDARIKNERRMREKASLIEKLGNKYN